MGFLCAPVQNCQCLTQNICSASQLRSEAVNSHKVLIFRRLGATSRLTQSHSRRKPYTFRAADSNNNSRGAGEEETPPAACQPITTSLQFDFPTPPLRLASTASRGTRPRALIGRFSRLCGSHLNTPPFEAERSAAASNIRGAETQWRPEQHRSTAERLQAHPDFTQHRHKLHNRPGSPAAAPAATQVVS